MEDADPFYHDGSDVGVLISHGFSGSPRSVKPWGKNLAERGYTVSVPRLPGHGTSWQEMNKTRWEDWYGQIEREYAKLREKCSDVFVMGLSMGGSLAIRLAEEQSDVAGLVIVNPAVHSERPDRFLLPYIRHVVPAFPGITNDINKPGMDEGGYTKLPLQAAFSLTQMWDVVKRDISRITQPVMVLRSSEDHVVEASNSQWILDNVASDDLTFVELRNSFHVATLDYDADVIFDESARFMERVLAARV